MKSTNLFQSKEKSLLENPSRHGNNYEDSIKYRIEDNCSSENCMQFVKVIFCLVVAFMILFIGWTGWIYLTPKLSSSNCRTDKPLDDSEFRRILYGLDRRRENEDSNGISPEDIPWSSMPGNSVATSMKLVEDDQRYHVEIEMPTTPGIETDNVIAEKWMQLWPGTVKDLKAAIKNQDKDESDLPRRKVASTNPNDNIASDSNSPYRATSTISQSDNNRLSDDGTVQPAMKIKRSIWSTFDEVDPDREKCEKSLDPAYGMMDELAIAFLTGDAYNLRIVEFREKFIEYLTRFFWYRILPGPDERQRIVKKSDNQVQSLLSALSNLVTNFGREYNFVKRSPPTQEMTQQFRVIIETVVFGFEKCMWQQELARRATPGGRFKDYE